MKKTLLISIALFAALSFSVYAGCCVLETSPNPVYWDFGNWGPQTSFCSNLGAFLGLNSPWYPTACDTSNSTMNISSGIDGWSSPTPISTPSGNTGGGGGGGGRDTPPPVCEEIGYICDDWSVCVNGGQTRTCTRRMICGNVPAAQTVAEERACTTTETAEEKIGVETLEEGAAEQNVAEEAGGLGAITGAAVADVDGSGENVFSKITGAVVGPIKNAPWAYAITFTLIIAGLLSWAYFFKPKGKK